MHRARAGGLIQLRLRLVRAETSAEDGPARARRRRLFGQELHHAAECGVAPSTGAAARHNLDGGEGIDRNLAPGDPAAERIIERHAVEQHKGTARAARTDAAERDALRGGIGHKAVRASEQAEAGHAAEGAIERDRGAAPDRIARNHDVGKGDALGGLDGAGGRHEDRVQRQRLGLEAGGRGKQEAEAGAEESHADEGTRVRAVGKPPPCSLRIHLAGASAARYLTR